MSYVVFTASVLTLMAVAAATDRNKPFKAHLDLSNTPSAVGLLFESQAASIARCAVLCSSDACCSRFNFAKSGSTPGVCRAYRTGMTSGSSGTSAVRSGTFILQGKEVSGTPTNVALNKPANQSSLYEIHTADRAVDGSLNVHLNEHSCAHTDLVAGVRAWWQVDLGSSYRVTSVTITNRDCYSQCGDRLRDFDIDVYSQNPVTDPAAVPVSCYHYNGPMGRAVTEDFPCCGAPITGRFVRVTDTPDEYLTLCEVQVMAVPFN